MRLFRRFRVALTLAWLLSLPASPQEKATRLGASDIFNLQWASDPQISGDGQHIVYVRAFADIMSDFADIMSDKRLSNLWLIDFDGGNNHALTTGNFNDESPRWSSDGTRIAFLSDRDGKPQLYVRWMDSGQTAKLTSLESGVSHITWSLDGKRLAFASLLRATILRENCPCPDSGTDPACLRRNGS